MLDGDRSPPHGARAMIERNTDDVVLDATAPTGDV